MAIYNTSYGGERREGDTKAQSILWPPLATLNRSWTWVTQASLSPCMKGKPDLKDLCTSTRCLTYRGELRFRERLFPLHPGGHLLLSVWARPWGLKWELPALDTLQTSSYLLLTKPHEESITVPVSEMKKQDRGGKSLAPVIIESGSEFRSVCSHCFDRSTALR